MKRFIAVCSLLLALILIGCARSKVAESTDTPGSSFEPTIPSSTPVSLPDPVTTGAPETTVPPMTTGSTEAASAPGGSTPDTSVPEPSTPDTSAPVTAGSATTPQVTPESTAAPTVTTTEPVTTPATSPATTTAAVTTTPEVTTSAVTTPETPPVTESPAPEIDPSKEDYQEDSTIIYAKGAMTLYQNGEWVPVEADTALLRTGIGDRFTRVRWQGGTAYVYTDDTTGDRPQSAVDLAEEKGGIYYKGSGPLIVIDAGHQDHSMKDKEPLGPGSTDMKAKLSSGTSGVATRIAEYKLNLAVALLLRDELIGRGYSVVMIRETNNVEMSNAERAEIANAYNADAFIRIHANGSEDQTVRGAYTLCQTSKNPYNGELYAESKRLAENILDKYIDSTGFTKKKIWETDTMTGINWANVPVTLIEMGYMSNADEDIIMATEEFRRTAAIGMADGFDLYFGRE